MQTQGGPCTTPNELELCIQNKPDIAEKIVRNELSYYVHTHHTERNMEPALFKIMVQHDECFFLKCYLAAPRPTASLT